MSHIIFPQIIIPSLASSSTSTRPKSFKYDVFLSFRGEDTRKNFIDSLYSALQQKNISTYKDDERIEKGKSIKDELMGSIQDSKYFIIVFSKNYASSSWCLDELQKITECQKTTEHTVYPVFYDVEPTEVRNQTGAVGEAFSIHKKEEAVGRWRKALKEAADVAGWELKNTADGHEAKFIRQIIEKLSLELRAINFRIDDRLVGMETRINNIVSSLGIISDDVRMIGIWGIGGGGKTTLARAVFDQISFDFEEKSFVENVREVTIAHLSGLKSLQSQILSNVLDNHAINVGSVNEGENMLSRMMRDRKTLLVLDDVDHVDQLDALVGDPSWFKRGSVIIITTRDEQVLVARDEQVLVAHGVKIHNVNLLSDKEAIWWFQRYALGREIPKGYEELSEQVVSYAAGLPLTIKVLGSSLCGKSRLEWVDALARLKTIPLKETQQKLELSYTGLDDDYKKMFLDVATILKGWRKMPTIEALESCGFHARIGLRVLQQKSLVTFYYDGNHGECVGMHDHLKEMGRNIVCRLHPVMPNKHSRLWDNKEIADILVDDSGTEATKCIQWLTSRDNWGPLMNGLRKMKELRFLNVFGTYSNTNQEINEFSPHFQPTLRYLCCNWNFDEVHPYFPESLRYLSWDNYPFTYLPKTFQANNLVGLVMFNNNIVRLWEGGKIKVLEKLRFLSLSGRNLRAFDLRLTPNLETLTLSGLGELVELYMPVACLKLRCIKLYGVKLRTLDLGLTPNLEELSLDRCDLVELHIADECVKLKILSLRGLKLIRTLDLGSSPNLKVFDLLQCNDLEEVHIAESPILRDIKISGSKLRTIDIGLAPILTHLRFEHYYDLEELHLGNQCQKLVDLSISHSKLRTLYLGRTPNLKKLYLKECYDLEELHMANQCQKLVDINISHLPLRTLDLGLTPNLEKLYLKGCYNLVELAPITCLKTLDILQFSGGLGFITFSFRMLSLRHSSLSFTLKICPFHPDNNLSDFHSTWFVIEDLPSWTRSIEKLIFGGLCACTKFETFSRSISGLQFKIIEKLKV